MAPAAPAPAPTKAMRMKSADLDELETQGQGRGAGGLGAARAHGAYGHVAMEDKAKAKKDERPATALRVVESGRQSLGDPSALLAAVKAAVVRAHGCGEAPTLKLRLTVDASGRVVKVERLDGDGKVPTCLSSALAGLQSATRPVGTTGQLVLTISGL